ncbi:uracil-DNA glycosylase [Nocardia farcinica]|uniref:uracil-DNA glycosylase n=1 Tax=Nocardia farcinica TaxID=37329 RepID=UPI0011453868|nr:uracil-DNA glycosylase [Nocardia farcinica]
MTTRRRIVAAGRPPTPITIAGRMRDPVHRESQLAHRYDPHVAPINRLVDDLREESGRPLPHVAPACGGVHARVLVLCHDPGPPARQVTGSGMLSLENDDPAAERLHAIVGRAGLTVLDLVPWNIHPWYLEHSTDPPDLDGGLAALDRLLALLPELRAVVAHGRDVRNAWQDVTRLRPRSLPTLIETYDPDRRELWTPDAAERAGREAHLREAYERAAQLLEPDGG